MTTTTLEGFPTAPHWADWQQDGDRFYAECEVGVIDLGGIGSEPVTVRVARTMFVGVGTAEVGEDRIMCGDDELTAEQARELIRLLDVAVRALGAAATA